MLFMLKIRYAPAPGLTPEEAKELRRRHDEHASGLAAKGTLHGIWRIAATQSNFSLWQAGNAQELHDVISQLPLFPHMRVEVVPLAKHHLSEFCRFADQDLPASSDDKA